MIKRLLYFSFLLSVFLFCFSKIASVKAQKDLEEEKNVLLIHSYERTFKWTNDITNGIIKTFGASDYAINLSVEYMHTKHFYSENYLAKYKSLFLEKYKDKNFDVIITSDNNALEFIKTIRNEILKNTPVVFCGINDFSKEMIVGIENITGVNEKIDPTNTFNLILNQNPDLNKIHVITDHSVTGKIINEEIREAAKNLNIENKVNYLDTLSLVEITDFTSELTKGDVIFYTFFFKDITGFSTSNKNSLKFIYENSRVPIYGTWDFNINNGLLGGMLTSGKLQGKCAADQTLKILSGKDADEIPVILESTNEYIFDYLELKRFGYDLETLPEGSKVLNKPFSFYSEYKTVIWITIAIIIILSVIILLLNLNIQKRKIAEAKLKESEDKFRAIFNQSFQFIGLLDNKGMILKVNNSALEFIGSSEDLVLDEYMWNTHWFNYSESIKNSIKEGVKIAASGNFFRSELPHQNLKNEIRKFDFSLKPVKDECGNVTFLIAEGRDIHDLEKIKRERKHLLEELLEKNRELEQIVYASSHDLRTPMLNIQGFSKEIENSFEEVKVELNGICDLKDEKKLNQLIMEEVPESISFIKANINRMEILLSGLLQFTRIGQIVPEIKEIKMEKLILDIRSALEKELGNRKIEFLIENINDCYGDEVQINHVFTNLIDNAIKYLDSNRKGKIKISSKIDYKYAIYCIEDNGIGIEERNIEKIFRIFHRLEPNMIEGKGLGLTLVAKLLYKNKGEVWVESKLGVGSKFFVKLPSTQN